MDSREDVGTIRNGQLLEAAHVLAWKDEQIPAIGTAHDDNVVVDGVALRTCMAVSRPSRDSA